MSPRQVFALLGCVVLATACDGPGVVGPGSQVVGVIGGGTTTSTALVAGTWNRTLLFVDEFGFTNSNETTWQFAPDGTARRTLLTRNLSLGLADIIESAARWQVQGTRIIIDFVPPNAGHLELEFRFDAGQLILAGQAFTRIAS